jgi:tRNA 2-thiouridine synthesizing protein A
MSAEVMTKRRDKIGLTKVDRQINLKGEVCPYTFVKSLLTLEEMEEGQVLQVIVDHLPAVENVPRSLINEGYEILEVSQINDTDWLITVKNVPWQE